MGPPERRDAWDPDRYARFRDERRAPFLDLLALIEPHPGMRVVDLGCGSGELTRLAHERLGASETLGVDSSPAMLERARPLAGGGLSFAPGDAGAFAGRGYDLVLSNAALHWVPDHAGLLPRLAACLGEGGQLAVQVPANEDHPSHALARAVAAEPPFRDALGGHVRRSPVLAPEEYAQLLFRAGFRARRVRVEVYGHPLAARDEVVEWVRGTLLTDYEKRLAPDVWGAFLARYRERLLAALPDERPFLYTYRRVLLWARR
ncbi:MAG TPA: methyltransferase domain-containing protein [Anaeromyxobacteraceae bacterium]|nr:methyltransferase domain-containing protein [Anaeromyxobacteraceae bacterium]